MKTKQQLDKVIASHRDHHNDTYDQVYQRLRSTHDVFRDANITLTHGEMTNLTYHQNCPIIIDLSQDRPMAAYCTQYAKNQYSVYESNIRVARADFMDRNGKLHSHWVDNNMSDGIRWTDYLFNETYMRTEAPEEMKVKMNFVGYVIDDINFYHSWAKYSDLMTLPKAINALRKSINLAPLDPPVTNRILADIQTIVDNATPVVDLWDGKPSCIYTSENADYPVNLGSCMSGNPASWFELYDDLYNSGKLKILVVWKSVTCERVAGNHVARALVWCDSQGTPKWIDRLYARQRHGSIDPNIVDLVYDWCVANNITKTVSYKNTALLSKGLDKTSLRIKPDYDIENYDHLPYVDSLCYWCSDGYLRDSNAGHRVVRTLDQTDGSSNDENEDNVEDIDGEWINEEDARDYVDGGYIHCDNAEMLSSVYYNEWVYERHGETTEDYDNQTIRDCDRQLCRDGEYCHDSVAIYLDYCREYAHPSMEVVETCHGHDAWIDDVTCLHDGSYCLTENAVEISGGRWAWDQDPNLVMIDGDYFLQDECEETDEELQVR